MVFRGKYSIFHLHSSNVLPLTLRWRFHVHTKMSYIFIVKYKEKLQWLQIDLLTWHAYKIQVVYKFVNPHCNIYFVTALAYVFTVEQCCDTAYTLRYHTNNIPSCTGWNRVIVCKIIMVKVKGNIYIIIIMIDLIIINMPKLRLMLADYRLMTRHFRSKCVWRVFGDTGVGNTRINDINEARINKLNQKILLCYKTKI